jgi:hypothetical protein
MVANYRHRCIQKQTDGSLEKPKTKKQNSTAIT